MDFSTTEAADDLGGLARTITESVCTAEHQRELDGLEQRFDRDLWGKLIEADILSTAAPESLGGGGFGVLEQVAVLVALGRQLAAVPYLESVVLGAGALAKFGSESLQQEWATPAINGEKIIAVALDGEMGEGPVQAQSSGPDGSDYRLTGTRTQVALRPGRRRVPRSRRNRFRNKSFPRRCGRRRGVSHVAEHHRPRQCRASRAAGCRGRSGRRR